MIGLLSHLKKYWEVEVGEIIRCFQMVEFKNIGEVELEDFEDFRFTVRGKDTEYTTIVLMGEVMIFWLEEDGHEYFGFNSSSKKQAEEMLTLGTWIVCKN